MIVVIGDGDDVRAQCVLDEMLRSFEDLVGVDPLGDRQDQPRVDGRHFENVLEESRQPGDFLDDHLDLVHPLRIGQPAAAQVVGGDANRGQRRAQVVRERGEQRRFELGAALRQLGLLALVQEVRALDRDRDDPGQRRQRARINRPAGRREESDGADADPQRCEREQGAADILHGGAGHRFERLVQFSRRQVALGPEGAGFEAIELADGRQIDRGVLELEAGRHMAREIRDDIAALGRQQNVAAQFEQPRELVAAGERVALTLAGEERQPARDQADRQEREQRDPVLRIGDREGADRRQEEEVDAQHRRQRCRDRHPEPGSGRGQQHDDQEQQRHRGGVVQPQRMQQYR